MQKALAACRGSCVRQSLAASARITACIELLCVKGGVCRYLISRGNLVLSALGAAGQQQVLSLHEATDIMVCLRCLYSTWLHCSAAHSIGVSAACAQVFLMKAVCRCVLESVLHNIRCIAI